MCRTARDLLKDFDSTPEHSRKLSLVLLVSRPPSDIPKLTAAIEEIRKLVPNTELHVVSTVATVTVEQQWDEFAKQLPAFIGSAQTHRELPNALIECYRQLGAFDEAYAEELGAIKAAIEKCCREKQALCKLIDKLGPHVPPVTPPDCTSIEKKLDQLIATVTTINEQLNSLSIKISDSLFLKLKEQIDTLRADITKLTEEIALLKADIKTIKESLIRIEEKIGKIQGIDVNIDELEARIKKIISGLFGWLYLLLLLALCALACIVFVALLCRKTHQQVQHACNPNYDTGSKPTLPKTH